MHADPLGLTEAEVLRVRARVAAGDRGAMPGMVRVSFAAYNTTDEVDLLVEALVRISRGRHRGTYVQDRASGEYSALGWAPDLAGHFSLASGRPAHERLVPRKPGSQAA